MTFAEFLQKLMAWGLEIFGLFYGSYPAEVVEVLTEGIPGRIRVKCATLWGIEAPAGIFLLPKYGPAGQHHGFWHPPVVGDIVWVECRLGNPKKAEYVGGYWRSTDLPDGLGVGVYAWVTPDGWKLRFDATTAKIASPNDTVRFTLDLATNKATVHATNVTLEADAIRLGTDAAAQPVVLGYQLISWLASHTHGHPLGPTLPPIQAPTLSSVLSVKHKVDA